MKQRWLIVFLLSFFSLNSWSESLNVELSEAEPVVGENFQIIFKITLDENETPDIKFDGGGLEVLGKSNQGMSLKTVYANGKLTTTREMTYVYDLIANKKQSYIISGIRVETSNGTLTHPDITIKPVNEAREKSPFFVRAEVSKTKAYVGEGILVNYYLYHLDNVLSTEIKKFPTLNNFTKRFYDKQAQTETVSYNGAVYRRTNFYSAMLFPDVPGQLKIDPITIGVAYVVGQADPFGGFGFSYGGQRKMEKSINSEPVIIEVMSLPHNNVPPSYTGLVGKHTFKLVVSRNKALVNDPVDVKLTAEGAGALEKMEIPKVFSHPELEEFDSKFELNTEQMGLAQKIFSLTYLGRNSLDIVARKMPLSYFDPEKGDYVTVELDVPGLKIEGGTVADKKFNQENSSGDDERKSDEVESVKSKDSSISTEGTVELLAPTFGSTPFKSYFGFGSLAILILFIFIGAFSYGRSLNVNVAPVPAHISFAYEKLKTNGLNYGDLYRFLITGLNAHYSEALFDQIQNSKLSEAAKTYMCQILEATEKAEYLEKGKKIDLPFKKKYFEEIIKYFSKTSGVQS